MYNRGILKLTEIHLDWLVERVPDPPQSPLGGRPAADKRKVMQGIFWMLDVPFAKSLCSTSSVW